MIGLKYGDGPDYRATAYPKAVEFMDRFKEMNASYKEELKPVFYTYGYNFFLTLWNLNYAYYKAQNKAQKSMMSDENIYCCFLRKPLH